MAASRPEKIAIVRSGPVGLATADYLAKQGYQLRVFEKLPVAGGMKAVNKPEYRRLCDILANVK